MSDLISKYIDWLTKKVLRDVLRCSSYVDKRFKDVKREDEFRNK